MVKPIVDDIMDFESGEMGEERIVPFVQGLIDSGLAWTLQGSYGRLARNCIEAGLCEEAKQREELPLTPPFVP